MANFVTVTITIRKGEVPVSGAAVVWRLTATPPIALPIYFESIRSRSATTGTDGKATLRLPTASYLANNGVSPSGVEISCIEVGLKRLVYVPDEDCDVYDLVDGPDPSLPIVQLQYRTATKWLDSVSSGPLSSSLGREGDYYLDFETGDVYLRGEFDWTLQGSIKGAGSSWLDISDKPSSFPPSAHTHGISDIASLQDALDAKAGSTATTAALASKEPSIPLGLATQYWDGTKTWKLLDKAAVGLSNVTNDAQLKAAQLGAANGVAPLGSDLKIASMYLPPVAITDTSVVASQAAMLALVAERGDVAVRSDLRKSFILAADDPTVLANWVELQTPADAVLSVNGQTGTVSLNAASVGLSAVTNDAQVKRSELGTGINQINSNGAALVGSRVVETNAAGLFISVAKATGYNLPLGTTANTLAEGIHNHDTLYGRLAVANTWAEVQSASKGVLMPYDPGQLGYGIRWSATDGSDLASLLSAGVSSLLLRLKIAGSSFQITSSTGTQIARFFDSGSVAIGAGNGSGSLQAVARATNVTPFYADGMAGQTAALFKLRQVSSALAPRDCGTINATMPVTTDATRTGRLTIAADDFAASRVGVTVEADGTQTKLSFFNGATVAKPTVSGSRGGNAAIASLITALASLGLVTDSTTA